MASSSVSAVADSEATLTTEGGTDFSLLGFVLL
jgi:hypothetical protein